jgi:2-aminoadipate transaminase
VSEPDFGVVDHIAQARPNVLRELIQLSLERRDLVSFSGGLPADELFDTDGIRAATESVARLNDVAALQYGATEGLPVLRAQVAALTQARGIRAEPGQVIVTSGSQQAIDVATRCLVAPGDVVLTEKPTFITALQTFRTAQADIRGVDCDADGPIPEALEAMIAECGTQGQRIKLLYLVPTFSNPAGRVTSLARRKAILDIVLSAGIMVLEDDPYGELWFDVRPPPPLRALVAGDAQAESRILYTSSLSKTVSPGLRVGWIVLPEALVQPFRLMKSTADVHSSIFAQHVMSAYLAQDRLSARIPLLRAAYGAKAKAMGEGLARHAPQLAFETPQGGMFIWAKLPDGLAPAAFSRHALTQAGVAVVPGDPFFPDGPDENRLRLSFTQGDIGTIRDGVERLGRALGSFAT